MNPPPLQADRDREHIRLLAIFHFVTGGLALVFLPMLGAHYWLMQSVIRDFPQSQMARPNSEQQARQTSTEAPAPPAMPQPKPAPFPKDFFLLIRWFYFFIGSMMTLASAANIASGIMMLKLKGRVFSIVIGCLNCLQIPFGTVLGVFTIVVLSRDSVSVLYQEKAAASRPR